MRCGERFNQKIPDLKPLVIAADVSGYVLIGCATVMEEIMECTPRCIHRDIKPARKHIKPPYMIPMLMGDQDRTYLTGVKRSVIHPLERLFCAQAGIQQECPGRTFEKNTVSFASAGQYRAAHRPIIGRSRIRVFNFLQYTLQGRDRHKRFNRNPE
jgi:hypothetical protein